MIVKHQSHGSRTKGSNSQVSPGASRETKPKGVGGAEVSGSGNPGEGGRGILAPGAGA
jgi:hypothetical protein